MIDPELSKADVDILIQILGKERYDKIATLHGIIVTYTPKQEKKK